MSTKKEIWRLLEPEVDVWQAGDEIQNPIVKWERVPPSWINWEVGRDSQLGRRRMTLPDPQGWISVKERMPTKEDASKEGLIIWGWNDNSCLPLDWRTGIHQELKWWRPFKFEPVPFTDPDEEAWEEWSKKNLMRNYSVGNAEADAALKEGFMAGRKSVATDGGAS